jgi:hypothetical protein
VTNRRILQPRHLGAIVLGLVVVAVAVAAVITALRPVEDLDPNSPEGVVQGFFRAIEASDYDGAHTFLTSDLQADCTPADLASYVSDFDRVVIDEVIPSGPITLVRVEVQHIDATDPLNPYTYTEVLDFEIEVENGRPAISLLPWPFFCEA